MKKRDKLMTNHETGMTTLVTKMEHIYKRTKMYCTLMALIKLLMVHIHTLMTNLDTFMTNLDALTTNLDILMA